MSSTPHDPYALSSGAPHLLSRRGGSRAGAVAAHRHPGGDNLDPRHAGPIRQTDPCVSFKDWTNGCISVGNIAIEEIWQAVDDGTPIEIRP